MRLEAIKAACLALLIPVPCAMGQSAEGELVRLPGNGAAKTTLPGERPDRYVPGGGLLLSFDKDRDSIVTPQERALGIQEAFLEADANGDGVLSALEQQAWASSLPTRDESLANPVRFDPNLDRMVSKDEFTQVVETIATAYVDPDTGNINVEDLKAKEESLPRRLQEQTRLLMAPRMNF